MMAFFMAWQMFLWIPCPVQKWDESKRLAMLLNMPVIGLMVGLLWYALSFAAKNFLGAALLAILPWIVTGFMHIDGYMDCADAVLSFKPREKKLKILKDSHVGSFAVVSMVILAVLQYAASLQIVQNESLDLSLLIFIPALARGLSVLNILCWDCLETSSYAKIKTEVQPKHKTVIITEIIVLIAGTAALLFITGHYKEIAAIAIEILAQELIMLYLRHNLGGMSGDISGSGIVTGELASLIALALI